MRLWIDRSVADGGDFTTVITIDCRPEVAAAVAWGMSPRTVYATYNMAELTAPNIDTITETPKMRYILDKPGEVQIGKQHGRFAKYPWYVRIWRWLTYQP
jgi:hypothetical protein